MSFLRHVGRHGDRKVAVVFREVPNEEHMCLVVYTQLLNQNIHDPMMSCIEGDIGQHSDELASALNRQFTRAGEPILQVLHREGMLKKVRTEEVIMTPQSNTKIRLDELNKILRDMKSGEDATRRLAEADSSRGLQDPADVRRRKEGLLGEKERAVPTAGVNVLHDDALAQNLMAQAQKMQAEANSLMAESKRLLDEATALLPKPTKITKPKATTKKKTTTAVKA